MSNFAAGKVLRLLSLCLSFALIALSLMPPSGAPSVRAAGSKRVGIVVGDTKKCVTFDSDAISGLDALKKAFSVESSSGAVCKIDSTGCPASNCWCQCPVPDSTCQFWSYWHLEGGEWHYSDIGASQYQLRDGDIDGWVWGALPPPQGDGRPPSIRPSIDEICGTSGSSSSGTKSAPKSTTKTAPDPKINFSLSSSQIVQGTCASLTWEVSGAKEVYLDDQGVIGVETRQVCPEVGTHTYELRVIGPDKREFVREVTLSVVPPTPTETPTFTPLPLVAPRVATPTPTQELHTPTPSPTATETSTPTPTATLTPTPTDSATATALALLLTSQASGSGVNQPKDAAARPRGFLASRTAWFVIMVSTIIGAVGIGGLIFVGLLIGLAVVYWYFSRRQADDSE